jgi:hypothetical protein
MSPISVLFRKEEESLSAFKRRILEAKGDVIVILSPEDNEHFAAHTDERDVFIKELAAARSRIRIATKNERIGAAARKKGIRVIDRTRTMKLLLKNHEGAAEALRLFSPHLWRQQLRSRLQVMGLLSLPKLRIWLLILVSTSLFIFVLFRLLPSAEVLVKPREDAVSQTANIFLVDSGATVYLHPKVRTLLLIPIGVTVQKTITFDQISKEFIGARSSVMMTIVNTTSEQYSFKKESRLKNQAGMIFRIKNSVIVEAGKEASVKAEAEPTDTFGEIIGERGNVPANLKWEFMGLRPEEATLVYAINKVAAKGGTSAFRTVLRKEDLEVARKRLEQELLKTAQQEAENQRSFRMMSTGRLHVQMLNYDQLRKLSYHNEVLPVDSIGKPVNSVPVSGMLNYKAYAYDADEILSMLRLELSSHIEEGKRLLPESIRLDNLIVNVIDYDDNFAWIKLTVDLTAKQEYILDPLTPWGLKFGKKVREAIVNLPRGDAQRIVENFPEVEKATIRLWPPWNLNLPLLPSNISVTPSS